MARLILEGNPVAPGIALGPIIMAEGANLEDRRTITDSEIASELAALSRASTKVYASLKRKLKSIPENLEDYRDMLEMQMELARDAKILDGARARVAMRKICASWALSETFEELVSLFNSLPEAFARDRTEDILAIKQCMLSQLTQSSQAPSLDGILAVQVLSPGDIINLGNTAVKAIITVEGGATAHALILARSYKIPVVCGLGGLFDAIHNAKMAIVDGFEGKVLLDPEPEEIERYQTASERFVKLEEVINARSKKPAITKDGKRIKVMANLETASQCRQVRACGAEGVGLYRTETTYLQGGTPTEESLYQEYVKVLAKCGRLPVVFRTLDAGADKLLPENLRLHEENPALGLRGIRFCLAHPDIFETQLKALLRAGSVASPGLLLPMVTTIREIRDTRALLKKISRQLRKDGIPHAETLPLGVMVETPAAALIVDELLTHCDFISIGTNDLLHYLLAIDRGNRHVAALQSPLHPAFLRILRDIMLEAEKRKIPVSVCGELASDPRGVILLIGLGITTLSATPRFVPALKHLIGQLDFSACRELVARAVNDFHPAHIRKAMREMLEPLGFGAKPALMENLAFGAL